MMMIIFFVAAIAVLIAGVGGAVGAHFGMIPEGLSVIAPLMQSVSVSAGTTLALLGLALAAKKTKKLDRLVGGNTMSSRLRRNRVKSRSQADSDDVEDAEEEIEVEVPASPRRATPTPRAMVEQTAEKATRQMRSSTGKISNRRKQAPSA